MGWWKVEGTEHLVGDDVFSLVRQAAISVATTYEEEFGRLPTRDEWSILIRAALQPVQETAASEPISLFKEDARPDVVDIRLKPMSTPR